MKTALTIAGSDSSGGAGIQADMKTMIANGVYAMSAITALTAQNTTGVQGIFEVTPEFLEQEIDSIFTDIRPDAVKIGMVSSTGLIKSIAKKLCEYQAENIVVDPVMGDYGKIYSTYTDEMCGLMKELVAGADIITPNITESCILTDTPYSDMLYEKDIVELAEKLSMMGPEKVVITGIVQGTFISNYCYEREKEGKKGYFVKALKIGTQRSGTGDIFTSIIAADAVNGVDFHKSVKKASSFIKKCIMKSIELDIPLTDGVCFEELLYSLK